MSQRDIAQIDDRWRGEVVLPLERWTEFDAIRQRLQRLRARCSFCDGHGAWMVDAGDSRTCPVCVRGMTDGWTAFRGWDREREPLWSRRVQNAVERAMDSRAFAALTEQLVTCPACSGTGKGESGFHCQVCNRMKTVSALTAALLFFVPCPHCGGAGWGGSPGMSWACGYCGGTGRSEASDALHYWPEWYESRRPWSFPTEPLLNGAGERAFQTWINDFDLRDYARPGIAWRHVEIEDHDLSDLDLQMADFTSSRLGILDRSNLTDATLDDAIIASAAGANFLRASLQRAALSQANLRGALFEDANLTNADLEDADLTGASIERAAALMGTILTGAAGLSNDQLAACRANGALFPDRSF